MSFASVISMLRLALACLVLGLFAVVPAANAASTTQILRDCADDGVLQGDYTPAELRKARQNIPTDTDEYTDCRDVLARAAAATIAGSGNGSGSGSGGAGGGGTPGSGALESPNTPEGQAAIGKAAGQGAPDPVRLGDRAVVPGAAGLNANAVRNELPTPLIVLLALLGTAALATTMPFVRRRVLARFRR
jgi:hypothetical protein